MSETKIGRFFRSKAKSPSEQPAAKAAKPKKPDTAKARSPLPERLVKELAPKEIYDRGVRAANSISQFVDKHQGSRELKDKLAGRRSEKLDSTLRNMLLKTGVSSESARLLVAHINNPKMNAEIISAAVLEDFGLSHETGKRAFEKLIDAARLSSKADKKTPINDLMIGIEQGSAAGHQRAASWASSVLEGPKKGVDAQKASYLVAILGASLVNGHSALPDGGVTVRFNTSSTRPQSKQGSFKRTMSRIDNRLEQVALSAMNAGTRGRLASRSVKRGVTKNVAAPVAATVYTGGRAVAMSAATAAGGSAIAGAAIGGGVVGMAAGLLHLGMGQGAYLGADAGAKTAIGALETAIGKGEKGKYGIKQRSKATGAKFSAKTKG